MSNASGESEMTPTESITTGTVGNFPHGSQETPATSASPMEADRPEKARCHKSGMHVVGESDGSIVPEKPANKGGSPPAELAEGRGLTEENAGQPLLGRTQRRNADGTPFAPRSRGLLGVREAARKDKKQKFTSLLHHITPELLRSSFFELKKTAAAGVDGETWQDYAVDFELHSEKTRLIEFGRYAEERRMKRGDGPPETFDFLGFTHISGKTRRGDFTIHRKTSRKKFQAKLAELKERLLRNRHADLATVGRWLQSVFRGWRQYYAVPGNYPRLQQFRDAIQAMWLRMLRRRSQRGRRLTWRKFSKLCKRWLPTPTILHPYPNARFACQHPR